MEKVAGIYKKNCHCEERTRYAREGDVANSSPMHIRYA